MKKDPDRPRFIERAQKPATPAEARRSRSTAMIVLGCLLLGILMTARATNPDGTFGGGAIVLGVLAVGLIVGGLVIRP